MKGSIGVARVGSRRVIHLVSDSGVRLGAAHARPATRGKRARPRRRSVSPSACRRSAPRLRCGTGCRRRVPAPDPARLALPDEHRSAAIQERGSRPSAP